MAGRDQLHHGVIDFDVGLLLASLQIRAPGERRADVFLKVLGVERRNYLPVQLTNQEEVAVR